MTYPTRWSLSMSLACFGLTATVALAIWFLGPSDNEGSGPVIAFLLGTTAVLEMTVGMIIIGPLSYWLVEKASKTVQAIAWVIGLIGILVGSYLLVFVVGATSFF